MAWNKCDLPASRAALAALAEKDPALSTRTVVVSARTGEGVCEFKERLARVVPVGTPRRVVADLVPAGSAVVLVCPIDASAPGAASSSRSSL